jgi:feruloyl-CoA synthase
MIERVERDPARLFAPPALAIERRPDGSIVLRSPLAPAPAERCVCDWLAVWAGRAPERLFLAERTSGGQWRRLGYGEALSQVQAIATWLLRRLGAARPPLAILADNGIDHALMALAAMQIGAPVAPISTAYALLSRDFAKLRTIVASLEPGVIYVADRERYAPALAAIAPLHRAAVVADVAALTRDADAAAVAAANAAVGPDTVAKILFTSGSTGEPKGVINTQRMLCSNQAAKAQLWPFLERTPPVIVDWLPWSHTFGGNHNFNMMLRNGGSLYIDAGRAAPGLFAATLANLREISPTVYFNVPRGYDLLVAALKADGELRRRFFARLQVIFYAAAALPQHLWEELDALARAATGERVAMVSSWGATETAPMAADCHYQAARSGVIGLPPPGIALKLVPSGSSYEIRVRGPNVTPGYWRRPDLADAAFDAEGFYRTGDAVRFADPARPEAGLMFDGRIAEDFKLTTGTWVNVTALRTAAISALAAVAQDLVVAGHDRDFVAFLAFPNLAACRTLAGVAAEAPAADVLHHPAVVEAVRAGLARLRAAGGGSSLFARRCLLLSEPPSIDAGEITDKAYINQRAVLQRRAALVERLFADKPDAEVIEIA